MVCPKCKAKIGVMKHELMVESGMVFVTRCIICGYWSNPHLKHTTRKPSPRACV
jgi:Zn ribbon nucleic-acid-binding protein